MTTKTRYVAEVPIEERDDDGIRWLVLECESGSKGWFVFLHRTLEEPCEFDHWFLTHEEALLQVESEWGIGPQSWREERV